MSRGHTKSRSQPGRRRLRRCHNKGNFDDGEVIDVEKINTDVVVVDDMESPCQRTCRNNQIPSVVINIDDDEVEQAPLKVENFPMSQCSDSDDDCFVFAGEANVSPNVTKNKGLKCGSSRNHYGMYHMSESSSLKSESSDLEMSESKSSASDSSDCEMMDDSSGDIREQWERAALRRKASDIGRHQTEDQASATGSCSVPEVPSDETTPHKAEVENCSNDPSSEHFEIPVQYSESESCNERETFSPCMAAAYGIGEDLLQTPKANYSVNGSNPPISTCHDEPAFRHMHDAVEENRVNLPEETAFETRGESSRDQETAYWSSVVDEILQDIMREQGDMCSSPGKCEQVPVETAFCSSEMANKISTQANNSPCPRDPGETAPCNHPTCLKNQVFSAVACFKDSKEEVSVHPGCCTEVQRESDVNHESTLQEKDNSISQELCSITNPNSQAGNEIAEHAASKEPEFENGLIGEREKHKESDEYKRAAKEEWASRQRELQIQAEEVQRLRKRKKAERHLLEMERRQKRRLEEIRETQKKAEETINLKEQYRTEIRMELDKLEKRYKDMASLLRGLGIHVGGGLFPKSSEVNSAYRQALLKFHPDRASKKDIHQQVEAEETFKLISRLKEKLLPIAY